MKAGQWAGGKGDKERISNYYAYTSNYEKIFNKDKIMSEKLQRDVYSDDYVCPDAIDLLEGDTIQWKRLWPKSGDEIARVEITIVKEVPGCVGEASGRGGSVFVVPLHKFVKEYEPAFK
tara:strand:- start:1569 stop:1925 length:357 start_codon:yes stop_codon:yes gene_type:complete